MKPIDVDFPFRVKFRPDASTHDNLGNPFREEDKIVARLLEQIRPHIDEEIADRLTDHIFQWHMKETFEDKANLDLDQWGFFRVADLSRGKFDQAVKSGERDKRWKAANRFSELILKSLCAALLFGAGVWAVLEGRLEYIFLTTVGTALVILDIATKFQGSRWNSRP